MDLRSITVTGFKRFRTSSTLQTNGKLVAILGPNEAGKSSLLQAIAHLNSDKVLSSDEISRGFEPTATTIIGRFYLSADECKAAGFSRPHWLIITKRSDGSRSYGFQPPIPSRDISHRSVISSHLDMVMSNEEIQSALDENDADLRSRIEASIAVLSSNEETLPTEALSRLRDTQYKIEQYFGASSDEIFGALDEQFELVHDLEGRPTPYAQAFSAIVSNIPDFIIFDEDARDLKSSYSISDLRTSVPTALSNLLEVSELDFEELLREIDAGHTSRVTTLERKASNTLGRKFQAA